MVFSTSQIDVCGSWRARRFVDLPGMLRIVVLGPKNLPIYTFQGTVDCVYTDANATTSPQCGCKVPMQG